MVRADADNAYLQVCDDGPGIPVAERDRVFERFVRLDADRSRHGGGSGLGLAIVAEIVAAHKGTVDISGREGGGTVLTCFGCTYASAPGSCGRVATVAEVSCRRRTHLIRAGSPRRGP
ncbi:putative two-component histidine kinase [Mycobacteroides abscessus subsp. abscessus]|nr:putative two-component histidine kinase [Mycobacteroides abscessus subsp. abscessus]